MALIAESADTWGISGPSFLAGFAGIGVVLLVFAIINRRTALRAPAQGGPQLPDATQIALLNGGPIGPCTRRSPACGRSARSMSAQTAR